MSKGRAALVCALVATTLLAVVVVRVAWNYRTGIGRSPDTLVAAKPSETLVVLPGTYDYSDLGLVLRVWIDATGIVQYTLKDATGKQLVVSSERASAYHRWAFVLDSSRRLWFFSSDVGSFV